MSTTSCGTRVAAVALAVALAQPTRLLPSSGMKVQVFVVDLSASMAAEDANERRVDSAKRVLRDLVAELPDGAEAAIVAAGPPHRVIAPLTGEHATLRRVIGELEPSDREGEAGEALALAAGMLRSAQEAEIHFVTDRAFDEDPLAELGPLPIRVHGVGDATTANTGIVSFEARRDPSSAFDWHVLVEVLNAGPEELEAELSLVLDDVLLEVRPWRLPAGQRTGRVFQDLPLGPGVLTASLSVSDALASDDRAQLVVEPRAFRSVTVVGDTHPALDRALASDPSIRVERATREQLERGELGLRPHSALVLSRTLPERLPSGPILVVEPPAERTRAPVRLATSAVTWDRLHPVTRLVDFSGVQVREIAWPRIAPGLESLAEIGRQPLILAGQREEGRLVVFNVDLAKSNLTQRVAFPILVASSVRWLTELETSFQRHAGRAGEPLTVRFSGPPAQVQVEDPSGELHDASLSGSRAIFTATERAGLYRLRWPGAATLAAINVLSGTETDLRPRWQPPQVDGQLAHVAASESARYEQPWWPAFATFALAVALGEWWLYRRREAW